jgi:glycerol dehydrogenase-like iron-containing ADH family enzyme
VTVAIAPGLLVRGPGALAALGPRVAALGRRALLVHGERGFAVAAEAIRASLAGAGVAAEEVVHLGPVTRAAIGRLATRVGHGGHDVVVGVGGGRVIDAAKGAAHLGGVPFVAVPTSPATCAATTALSIVYDEAGAWQGPLFVARCADVAVLDADLLAAAPDRLLASGAIDAWCKVVEVRLAARGAASGDRSDTLLHAALALCDVLGRYVDPATGALSDGLPKDPSARTTLAEAVVTLPGLIAGLAGEGNKLAAAHAVHNALTLLPGHERALHGELVAFGILVQAALDGAGDDELAARVGWLRRLGVDASLGALGCAGYHADPEPVLACLLAAPALRRAFPGTDRRTVADAMVRVERLCVGAAPEWAAPTGARP